MKFILLIPNDSDLVPDIKAYIEHTIKNMKKYSPILLFIFTSIGLIID